MATMSKRDYYEVLSVERTATGKQISEAYRKLALKYHPDRNPGDDEAVVKFKECAEAFEVLGDQDKRARYDRYGHAGVDQPGGGEHFHDINDIFAAFGDIFGDGAFGDLFGRRGAGGGRASKGGNVRCDLTLDLIEAAKGAAKTIKFKRHELCGTCSGSGAKPGTRPETCQYCGGSGQVVQATGFFRVQRTCPACAGRGKVVKDSCTDCRGSGAVLKQAVCDVRIPAGVDNGTRLCLRGEGEPSLDGGPPGDCFVFITVKDHPLFHREGQHLICELPITYSQAALGATVEVPTLAGPEDLVIPPGTQAGQLFKLTGRGLPDPRHHGVGDLVVQVHVDVPKKLTKKQEELLRQLAEEEKTNVSPHRKSFFEKLRDFFVPDETVQKSEE